MSHEENIQNSQTGEILQSVYKNARLAAKSTEAVLARCQNNELYGELCREQDRYKTVAAKARRGLAQMGMPANEAPAYLRKMIETGINVKTAACGKSTHLAQIMLKGTVNGIISMQKTLNRTHGADSGVRESAQRLLNREQMFCDNLKRYL